MRHIYTSLDIGSDTIKIAVCELYENKLNLLAACNTKAKGIKRGLITDFELASMSIKQAFNEIEQMLGFKIRKVIVSVSSYLAEYSIVHGSINVESGTVITPKDVMKSLEQAILTKKIDGREIVTVLPIDFKINDQLAIKDPVGLNGSKLSTRAVLVTVPKKNVYSVLGLLENLKIEVADISINNIGDLYTFKNKNLESGISAIINIGEDITNISLFNYGIILKSVILNSGSKLIDNDISQQYKIDLELAKRLKVKYALASKSQANSKDFIDLKNKDGNVIKINQRDISEIVENKLKDILDIAKNELNNLTSKKIDYIIITGGISNMQAIEYTAYDIFGKIANIGSIKMIGARDNIYSSVIGNIIYFISKLKLKGQNYTMVDDAEVNSGATLTRSTSDEALGKIFESYFND